MDPEGYDHRLYKWDQNVGRVLAIGENRQPTGEFWDRCVPDSPMFDH